MIVDALMFIVFGTLTFALLMCETVLAAIGIMSAQHRTDSTDW